MSAELIAETDRLTIREMDSAKDAEFIFALLNSPKFIEFIGDRGVRSVDEAAKFIDDRYRRSYRDHGFGLYTVEVKTSSTPVGVCGFVKRDSLPGPDLGFAFLPLYEGKGFGTESARAVLNYGREKLKFTRVLAITTLNNEASRNLLSKIGFVFESKLQTETETLNLFSIDLNS